MGHGESREGKGEHGSPRVAREGRDRWGLESADGDRDGEVGGGSKGDGSVGAECVDGGEGRVREEEADRDGGGCEGGGGGRGEAQVCGGGEGRGVGVERGGGVGGGCE